MKSTSKSDLELLAIQERGGIAESFHFGIAALVDAEGNLIESQGNPDSLIYPRSALKPIQALAMSRLGLSLTDEQRVVSMASHHANRRQVELVGEILASHGLTEADLQCPLDLPRNPEARVGKTKQRIFMNCSGKHAGFLATCKLNGWDTQGYLDPTHPLQVSIRELTEQLSGEKVSVTTVDGCGAPLFALSTAGLARAIAGFCAQAPGFLSAASAHPELIGDASTIDAGFIRAGLFSKIGAEGVLVVGTPQWGLALKVADGSLRPAADIVVAQVDGELTITEMGDPVFGDEGGTLVIRDGFNRRLESSTATGGG